MLFEVLVCGMVSLYELAHMDGAEYLESIGFEVEERDDGLIEVLTHSVVDEGRVVLVIDSEDVGEIVSGVYDYGTSVEDVFDEYVVERRFVEVES